VCGDRRHALSVSGQNVSDADVSDMELTDDPACLPDENHYRNYTDCRYSVCVDLVRTSVCSCPLVSSRVEKTVTVGGSSEIVGRQLPSQLRVTLYPQVSSACSRDCVWLSAVCAVHDLDLMCTASFPQWQRPLCCQWDLASFDKHGCGQV